MELRVLKYFLMVAREENITKAAQLLHITQPTLSRQLMLLEEAQHNPNRRRTAAEAPGAGDCGAGEQN